MAERISFRECTVRKISEREGDREERERKGGRVIRIIRAAVVHATRTNLHFK